MKKQTLIIVYLFLIFLFSFSLISADWFSDFLGKITGKVQSVPLNCESDEDCLFNQVCNKEIKQCIKMQADSGICTGSSVPCVDLKDYVSCKSQKGCSWGVLTINAVVVDNNLSSSCYGLVEDCKNFSKKIDCQTQQGCVWENSCIPDCVGKLCGNDGCGQTCGKCRENYECVNNLCIFKNETLNVSLSISTLKDEYKIGEKIELTDPPENRESSGISISKINDSFTFFNKEGMQTKGETFLKNDLSELSAHAKGYIIQFEKEPILVKKIELEKKAEKNQKSILNKIPLVNSLILKNEEIPQKLEKYSKLLNEDSELIKENILKELPFLSEKDIPHKYNLAFNGIVIYASDVEIKKIEKIKGVKKIYPNLEVKATLSDSISQINADDVWVLDKEGNNCSTSGKECLTGENITISIIDTGVDYTHKDLGSGFVDEKRDFVRITSSRLSLSFAIEMGQQISMDQDRIAYYSGSTIYLYNFNKKETKEIISLSNFEILRLNLKDQYLVYVAKNLSSINQTSLYLYNLKSGENFEITNLFEYIGTDKYGEGYEGGVGFIYVENGRVIYMKEDFETINNTSWLFSNIYVYNIQSRKTIRLTNASVDNQISLQKVSGNLVAYSTFSGGGFCYNQIEIDNLATGERKIIDEAPHIGGIADLEGNKLLYKTCGDEVTPGSFYLYDLESDKYEKIYFSESFKNNVPKEAVKDSFSIFSTLGWITKGEIGNNVIYFTNLDGTKIFAYDITEKRYVQINSFFLSGDLDVKGTNVCFLSNDKKIYCHEYNSSYAYPEATYSFGEKVIGGYDFVNHDEDPMDDQGHGTHCASIAAGNGALRGVAPNAKIYAYKVLDQLGFGYWDDVIAGIERSIDPNQDGNFLDKTDIISLSLGSRGGTPDDFLSQVVDIVSDTGVVVVVAAGNSGPEGRTIGSPGNSRKAITVGAIDKKDNLATFSSRGPVIWEDESKEEKMIIKPDITAPGVKICAAQASHKPWENQLCLDEEHIVLSGTSMATPHVAGVAALLKQKNPNWTSEEIKNALKFTAIDLNQKYSRVEQGYGRVDAKKVIELENPILNESVFDFYIYTDFKINNLYDKLKIKGNFPSDYDKLIVEYSDVKGIDYKKEGILILNYKNLLAELNLTKGKEGSLLPSGDYIIKARIWKNGIEEVAFTPVKFDGTLKKGWPKKLESGILSFNSILSLIDQPTIEDIDEDGINEIIFTYSCNGDEFPNLVAYSYNATIIKNLSLSEATNQWGAIVGNFNNNTNKEVLFYSCQNYRCGGNESRLVLFNPLTEKYKPFLYGMHPEVLISADLNNDGIKEVFFIDKLSTTPGTLVILSNLSTDNDKPQEPFFRLIPILGDNEITNQLYSVPFYLNLDKDPDLELLVLVKNSLKSKSSFYAFNIDGSKVDGFPKTFDFELECDKQVLQSNQTQIICVKVNNLKESTFLVIYLIKDQFNITTSKPLNLKEIIGKNNLFFIKSAYGNFGNEDYLITFFDSPETRSVLFISLKDLEVEKSYSFGSLNQGGSHAPIGRIKENEEFLFVGSDPWDNSEIFINFFNETVTFGHVAPIISTVISDVDGDSLNELISVDFGLNIYVRDLRGDLEKEWGEYYHDSSHSNCYISNNSFLTILPQRPQSKIVNEGDLEVTGILLMKLQKKLSDEWVDEKVVTNQTMLIFPKGLIKLDIGEGYGWNLKDIKPSTAGDYRVYSSFSTEHQQKEATWEFKVLPSSIKEKFTLVLN